MLTAHEAIVAISNLTYPSSAEGTKESRNAARLAHKVEVKNIEGQFAAYLADKYASDLARNTQDSIWQDAKDEALGSYYDLETHYIEFANANY